MRTMTSSCRMCGVTFHQPDDPGRKREFCSNACRQRAYRARGGRASGTRRESARQQQRRREEEAWAREEARKEQERQRSEDRRRQRSSSGAYTHSSAYAGDRWTWARDGDTTDQARWRRRCRLLMDRASHASTDTHEANACREKAEKLRERYGL